MNNTELHNKFTKELTDLVSKFHLANQDLFISNIDITHRVQAGGRLTIGGVSVSIIVQSSVFGIKNSKQEESS